MKIWRILLLIILVSLLSAGVYYLLHMPLNGIDDANIFFVYARNVVAGQGIVFSADSGRVEGFTSLLWLLITSFIFWVFPGKPERALVAVSILIQASALAVFLAALAQKLQRKNTEHRLLSGAAILCLVWLYASPVFLSWTILSLMDVGLVTAIFMLAAADLLLDPSGSSRRGELVRSGILTVLFLLSRPEGMAYALVYWLARWALPYFVQKRKDNFAVRCIPLGIYLLTLISLTIFRLSYFGWPFPNTYYAKVSPNLIYNLSQGGIYLWGFLRDNFLCIPLLLFVIYRLGVFFYGGIQKTRPENAVSSGEAGVYALLLAGLAVPVIAGGDHFQFYRFYQPIYPLFILGFLFWLAGSTFTSRWTAAQKTALGMALGAFFCVFANPNWLNFAKTTAINQEYGLAADGRRMGRKLNSAFAALPGYPVVGEYVVGGIAYTYQGSVIDLMGLNNIQMAHSPGERIGVKNHAAFNKDVFYQNPPQVLLPREINQTTVPKEYLGCGPSFTRKVLKDLECEPRFQDLYDFVVFAATLDKQPPYILAYIRKDALDNFMQNGLVAITVQSLNGNEQTP